MADTLKITVGFNEGVESSEYFGLINDLNDVFREKHLGTFVDRLAFARVPGIAQATLEKTFKHNVNAEEALSNGIRDDVQTWADRPENGGLISIAHLSIGRRE